MDERAPHHPVGCRLSRPPAIPHVARERGRSGPVGCAVTQRPGPLDTVHVMANDVVVLPRGRLVTPDELEETLGWTLKPEGLCRDDTCVIVPDRAGLERDGKIDATRVAELLDRPWAVDELSGVTAIGVPRDFRRGALHDLRAPDFTLPDLDGTPHALSDHRSKKRLLVAFSSW